MRYVANDGEIFAGIEAGMKPYYEQDGITIYHGDCREVLPELEQADLILTDPPYNVSEEGAAINHAGSGELAQRRDFGEWDRSDWSPAMLLSQSFSALREGGSMLAFCSDRLLSAYREHVGFQPRGTIVWEKTNPPPTPRPSYVSATEWIVWLQKPGAKATWNGSGFTLNILRYPICGGSDRTEHPTQKPFGLISELVIRHSDPGETILDPFMGSGTTLEAAKLAGRLAVGIDINERYCEIAANRLAQGVLFGAK